MASYDLPGQRCVPRRQSINPSYLPVQLTRFERLRQSDFGLIIVATRADLPFCGIDHGCALDVALDLIQTVGGCGVPREVAVKGVDVGLGVL